MSQYTAEDIEVLTGLEPVRKRPGMYTDTTRPNHLAQEVIDNSVDEALAGYCHNIQVKVGVDGSISVGDDGVLYMAIHLDVSDPDELGTADHPVFFCPFCGTKLQTPDEVDAKSGAAGPTN